MELVVLKFGGTSVSSLTSWQNIARIARNHQQQQRTPFIVCSAPSQISNLLETLLSQAVTQNYQTTLDAIKKIYVTLANELSIDFEHSISQYFDALYQSPLKKRNLLN